MKPPRSLDDLLGVALLGFALLCSSALLHDALAGFEPAAPRHAQA